jgi:hypothetical protein
MGVYLMVCVSLACILGRIPYRDMHLIDVRLIPLHAGIDAHLVARWLGVNTFTIR